MNAIIFSAIWGVVMMFGGVFFKKSQTATYVAIAGIVLLLLLNILEFSGTFQLHVESHGMLKFDNFGLHFNTIAFSCTLLYFLLNGSDIEKVGSNVSEYFSLIFFVLCGISIASSFNTLLLLFLGIEIMSIPLYITSEYTQNRCKKGDDVV